MKNIPQFTTPWGIAGLVLEEIPYRREAFIRIHAADEAYFSEFLAECVSFCRAAGAEKVRAAGHPALEGHPDYANVVKMRCCLASLPRSDGCLWPLLPENAEEFRQIYNRRMAAVPNAGTMTRSGMEKLLADGGGYFVHRDGQLLGLGIVSGDTIDAVVGVVPGAGATVLTALASVLPGPDGMLYVARENIPAMKLYTRLGFLPFQEVSHWYTVFDG